MASYNVILKPSLQKDFRRLTPQLLARVVERIVELQTNPYPPQAMKLSGAEHLYRLRIGDYRIIYEVDNGARQVIVQYVRHRREVYRIL